MKAIKYIGWWLLILAAILPSLRATGQNKETPTASWLMPGISYQVSSKLRWLTQVGLNQEQEAKFVYTQGFVELNKHVIVNAGYFFFLSQAGSTKSYMEHDAVAAATYTVPVGKLVVDDRNMLLGVFANNGRQQYFYRNRVRLSFPFTLYSNAARVYLFDEGYYSLNKGLWSRNRAGGGVSYNFSKFINVDVSYLHQRDAFSGRINLIFVQLTLNLYRKQQGLHS
jgi:hypothetical protein